MQAITFKSQVAMMFQTYKIDQGRNKGSKCWVKKTCNENEISAGALHRIRADRQHSVRAFQRRILVKKNKAQLPTFASIHPFGSLKMTKGQLVEYDGQKSLADEKATVVREWMLSQHSRTSKLLKRLQNS